MVVSSNLHLGKGIVRGDAFPFRRIIPGIPSGAVISSVIFTLKASLADADGSATIQKSITSSNVAGTGQVENVGTGGIGVIRFDLTATDTLAMIADQKYYFDIQVTLDSGDILTIESGITSAKEQVTQS